MKKSNSKSAWSAVVLSIALVPSVAFASTPTPDQARELCTAVADLGEYIMTARQQEIPGSDITRLLKKQIKNRSAHRMIDAMTISAYQEPKRNSDVGMRESIQSFRTKSETACYLSVAEEG